MFAVKREGAVERPFGEIGRATKLTREHDEPRTI
jgi:hypothetical protein